MRMKLSIAVVVLLVALAGCTAGGMDPSTAYENSEAVDSAELVTAEGEFGQTTLLNVTMAEPVEKNNEICTTSYNPALGVTQTTCNDNWHEATLTGVTVTTEEGEYERSVDAVSGETISIEISGDATYQFAIESENAPPTHFQLTVEDGEIVSAGYNDEY